MDRARQDQTRVDQTQQQPNWAEGPGTPLSAYALQPNAFDPLHPPRGVRVGQGQSLYDIAATYQVPLRALIEQNHLDPPFSVRPGTELTLPPPHVHRVTRGETLADVARDYNVDLRSLALLNRMQPPYEVREGDQIVLPAIARGIPPPFTGEVASATSPRGDAPAPRALPPQSASLTAPPQAGEQRVSAPPPANVHLAWPLRGDIVARFGPQPGGARLDGVEIAAQEGAPIAAADDGEVVYAGSDLNAYGTLVLVRHANGYVTAYGYARRALVREGQRVRAGQQIAEVGHVRDGPAKLLFQVRRGRDAIDPLPLLQN